MSMSTEEAHGNMMFSGLNNLQLCDKINSGGDQVDFIVISDTAGFAVNRGKRDNESGNIVYRDKKGEFHSVDFNACASNYKSQHESSSGNCIGERKADEWYFIFYTSGIKTKVVFEKAYVSNLFKHHCLSGSKSSRFITLQNLINETRYTTYDLS